VYLPALILAILASLVFITGGPARIGDRPIPGLGLALLTAALILQFVHVWGTPIVLRH
jgi:hypothetical protein